MNGSPTLREREAAIARVAKMLGLSIPAAKAWIEKRFGKASAIPARQLHTAIVDALRTRPSAFADDESEADGPQL